MATELPHTTTKQREILKLLYRYRFLNRIQIQSFVKHKDYKLINLWLKDLREKHYVEWIYSTNFAERTKPGIYYLGLNGIRFLRQIDVYAHEALSKRYRDASRTQTYSDRYLLLAECCRNMEIRSADDTSGVSYVFSTEADYENPDNEYHFLAESDYIRPLVCYVKTKNTGDNETITSHLMVMIEPTLPQYSLRKRLRNYVAFLDSGEWEDGTRHDELPIIMIVCPTKATCIYVKRYIRRLLADTYGDIDDVPEDIRIWLTTIELMKRTGSTGAIWERVR